MTVLRTIIPLLLFAGLAYYVWRRLVRAPGLRGKARIAATIAIAACIAPLVLVSIASAGKPPTVRGALAWPVYVGWALFALTFMWVLIVDVGRLLVWLGRKAARRPAPVDPARRELLARITGGAIATAAVGQVAIGLRGGLRAPDVVDVPMPLVRLPAAFDGFAIVQLTDLHIGGTIGREFIADLVARANAAGGDAIVLTGDQVTGFVDGWHLVWDRTADTLQLFSLERDPLDQAPIEHGPVFDDLRARLFAEIDRSYAAIP